MEIDEDDHPLDSGEPAETTEEAQKMSGRFRVTAVRIGWTVCAAGFLVAMIGTRRLAAGNQFNDNASHSLRSIGLLVMLSGAVIVLGVHRQRWLSTLFRAQVDAHNEPPNARAPSGILQRTITAMVMVIGFGIISWLVLWLCPLIIVGLYLSVVTWLFVGGAIVVIGSGTRLQRAFCAGAVVPLLMAAYQTWISCFLMGPVGPRSGASATDEAWEEFAARASELPAIMAMIGTHMLFPILAAWLAALALGITALAVRVLLYHINGEGGDSTSDPDPAP